MAAGVVAAAGGAETLPARRRTGSVL